MGSMPVAAGMDGMEEGGLGEPFAIGQSPTSTDGDTHMRAGRLAPMDTPDLFDWDQGGDSSYPLVVDIGTSVPAHGGAVGSGEAAKGTPATMSGSGGGLTTAPTTGSY